MTTYFNDFNSYTTGLAPSDWTERTNTGVISSTVVVGGSDKILSVVKTSSSRTMMSWNAIDGDGSTDNIEILTKYNFAVVTSTVVAGVALRASGASGSESQYHVTNFGAQLRLAKIVSGMVITISQTASLSLTANTWYWLRFRANSTSLKARIWADGGEEPGTWAIDTTDSAVSGTGWGGVYGFTSTCAPNYDTFGIGTAGDIAPSSGASAATSITFYPRFPRAILNF